MTKTKPANSEKQKSPFQIKLIATAIQNKTFDQAVIKAKDHNFSSVDIDVLSEKGCLYISRWEFNASTYERFIRKTFKASNSSDLRRILDRRLGEGAISPRAFQQIRNALMLLKCARIVKPDLEESIKSAQKQGSIKALLILIESIFCKYKEINNVGTPEDISSALSSALWHAIEFHKQFTKTDINSAILAGDLGVFILQSFLNANKLREIEIQADVFNMEAILVNERSVRFTDSSGLFMMYRNGFILTEIQTFLRNHKSIPENESFRTNVLEFGALLHKKGYIQKVDNPGRYRLMVNKEMIDAFKALVNTRDVFPEEYAYLADIGYELNLTKEAIDKYRSQLDLVELLKVRRFFAVMHIVFIDYLQTIEKDFSVILNSIVLSFDEDSFNSTAKYVLKRNFKYLKGFTYDGTNNVLDVQYRPIVKVGNQIIPLFATAYTSDTLRNYMRANRMRINSGGEDASLERMISDALVCHGINSKISRTICGNEKDLIFNFGETTFILECKNNLIGTSIYETRSTIDYLNKAVIQLDDVCKAPKPTVIDGEMFFSGKVVGAIILGNRLFSGAVFQGYKVVYINELISFLNSDELDMVEISHEQIVRTPIKKRGDLNESSLRSFLTYGVTPGNLKKVDNGLDLNKAIVTYDDYTLNGK